MALVIYQAPQSVTWNDEKTSNNVVELKTPYVGLSNQGATCYLNGLLQTLYMTPEFRKAMFMWNYDPVKDGAEELCIPLQLQKLFGLLQLSKQRSVDTIALTKSFGWEGNEIFQQQDVQELTRVLFDALEESFKGTVVENIIDELYAGQLIDYIRCIDVDYQSERIDKFLDFSLAIVPFNSEVAMHSLTECIEMFLRPEILNGDNKYYAEKFDKKVDAIKGLKFGKLPQIMAIQLKRFVYDFSGPNILQKKLNEIVKFPMILDMNKYVASRSAVPSDQSSTDGMNDGTTDVTGHTTDVSGDEFEQFLQEQMEILNKANQENESTDVKSGTSNPWGNGDKDEIMLDDIQIEGLPDLVDLSGKKSKDQIIEELEKRKNDSMSPEEVEELIATRGPWVYELYAVLIHSGAITGGHYFAYIKDLDSKTWWNFNDSNVSKIDEKIVQEAWGSKTTSYSNSNNSMYGLSNYYNGLYSNRSSAITTTTTLSSTNAYMLLYRKVSTDLMKSVSFPSDDLVPNYIKDVVRLEEEKRTRRIQEELEIKNRLNIRIIFNDVERLVFVKRTDTYLQLMTEIWKTFDLSEMIGSPVQQNKSIKGEESDHRLSVESSVMPCQTMSHDVLYDDPSTVSVRELLSTIGRTAEGFEENKSNSDNDVFTANALTMISLTDTKETTDSNYKIVKKEDFLTIPYDCFRLRNYNGYNKLKSDIYDLSQISSKLLSDLAFNEHKTYFLETRKFHEEWEVYYSDGLSVILDEFDLEKCSFKDSRSVRLPKFATVSDLKDVIAKWVPYDKSRIRLMKINNIGYNDARMELLNINERRLKEDLLVYDGFRLHFEEILEEANINSRESLAFEMYIHGRNRIELRVNKPPSEEFDQIITADCRWTVSELRKVIAKELGLNADEIRLFKASLRGQELKDGEQALTVNGIYTNMNIGVSIGKATPFGFNSIFFFHYKPIDHRPGVRALPILPTDDEEDLKEEVVVDKMDDVTSSLHNSNEIESDDLYSTEVRNNYHNINYNSPVNVDEVHNNEPVPVTIIPRQNDDINFDITENRMVDNDYNHDQNEEYETMSNEGVVDANEILSNFGDNFDGFCTPINGSDYGDQLIMSSNANEEFDPFQLSDQNNVNTFNNNIIQSSELNDECDSITNEIATSRAIAVVEDVDQLVDIIPTTTATVVNTRNLNMNERAYSPNSIIFNELDRNSLKDKLLVLTQDKEVATSLQTDDSIVPSNFGELMVRNGHQPAATLYEQLDIPISQSIYMTSNTRFEEVKLKLWQVLLDLQKIPPDTTVSQIRLREKTGNTIGRLIRDNKTSLDYQMYLHDGKALAYEILEKEDDLPPEETVNPTVSYTITYGNNNIGNVLVLVQRWHRSTWSLGERFEVYLQGSMTIRDVARALAIMTNIPIKSILAMIVPRDTEFSLSELNQKSPIRNYGRSWFDPSKEKKLLKFMSHEMRVQDGDLILLQDSSEPLKELTKADLKSIELVEIANKNPYFDGWNVTGNMSSSGSYASYPALPSSYQKSTVSSGGSNGMPISVGKEINSVMNDDYFLALSLQEDESFGKTGTRHNRTLSFDATVNNDTREFNKQGGYALFDDIINS
eukprot:gene4865-6816_t